MHSSLSSSFLNVVFQCSTALLATGCSRLPCADIEKTPEFERVRATRRLIDERMLTAMRAGVAEARRRSITVPADTDLPTAARRPDGTLDPMVRKYALDGDGRLRGEGHSMSALEDHVKQDLRELAKVQDATAIERCVLHYRR